MQGPRATAALSSWAEASWRDPGKPCRMTAAAALWKRILTAPADADLKSHYVEALSAQGHPRAEMYALAQRYQQLLDSVPTDPAATDQAAALKPRLDALYALALEDFAPAAARWGAIIHLIGGWPIELTIDAPGFDRHAAEIVATIPLRHLDLIAIRDQPDVFGLPQFAQIASLDGSRQSWSDQALASLASSAHVGALRWLNLSQCSITAAQVDVLAASQALRSVEILDLTDNLAPDPCDASTGYGIDWASGGIVPESIQLPGFGWELQEKYGTIRWLNPLWNYMRDYPPSRYSF